MEVNGTVVGLVELATAPLAAPLKPDVGSLLLWLLLPLAVCAGASYVVRRQLLLVGVSVVALAVGLGGYASYSVGTLGAEVRGTQTLVADQLRAMSQRAQAVLTERQLTVEPALKPEIGTRMRSAVRWGW